MSAMITLVGRPNVGKSSLFNALLGFRRSIVLDRPGTTVDRVEHSLKIDDRTLTLVDTEGVFSEAALAMEWLRSVIAQSDAVALVLDGSVGLTSADRWLLSELRTSEKPVAVVWNKIDRGEESERTDSAGFRTVFKVSASHRSGLDPLRQWIYRHAEDASTEQPQEIREIKLALLGRPNTGKSTLINRLVGRHISKVSPVAHTTRDPIFGKIDSDLGRLCIIDTAGMRRPRSVKDPLEQFSVSSSARMAREADVVFLCVAAQEAITDQDMRLLSLLEREGRPAAILLNFWDVVGKQERIELKKDSALSPFLAKYKTVEISGLTGTGVEKLAPLAFELAARSERRVKTSTLNTVMQRIMRENPPPSKGRGSFNILYASQVAIQPPTFVLFTNRAEGLPEAYRRYVENKLREDLKLWGQSFKVLYRQRRSGGTVQRPAVIRTKKEKRSVGRRTGNKANPRSSKELR